MHGMKPDSQYESMYDDARIAKLKELRRLMVEQEILGEDGAIDEQKLQEALDASETPAEGEEMEENEMEEGEEAAVEEDPLAIARRKFFKPEKKIERSPGTAVMIALGGMPGKKPMDGKKYRKG